jgi:hypothetical protein
MPSPRLNKAQAEKQQKALAEHNASPNKNTGAGVPRMSKGMGTVARKIADLTEPASEIIKKALIGGLVPEMEVWEGTPEEKQEILHKSKSAKFEIVEVEPEKLDSTGKLISEQLLVEVLIRYVPVSKTRVEIAKWVVSQDIALKKAIEESKQRKIALAVSQKKAEEIGAVAKNDPVQAAKEAAAKGEHVRDSGQIQDFEYEDEWDEPE